MSEKEEAVRIANAMLNRTSLDPDGDLSTLARQFLRAREEINAMREALEPFAKASTFTGGRADDDDIYDWMVADISVGDLRRAHSVLANFTVPQAAEARAADAKAGRKG